ncbi:hypothetical protein QYS48_16915 [Marivirga arenosa]|uniref:Uncharacterized protein n=1 Tax=Marivirga arenosa TaxID=3059076 RepID=A0AA49GK96_9BACT|nr:hypothetical protein [Marivirga sp. ABR2-2]WKK83923.2 hypothetical protein QYS48_16915 [Marivirga sp. ABR2-2]
MKWLTISIYGGPFISKLEARRAPSILFPAAFISDTRYGAEFGIGFKLNIYDVASVKINPLNLLIGNEYYRQGHINFMLNF